jgi:hypothetical protein
MHYVDGTFAVANATVAIESAPHDGTKSLS